MHVEEGPWEFQELIDWMQLDNNHRHYLKIVARDWQQGAIYGCPCGYTKDTKWPASHPEVPTVKL